MGCFDGVQLYKPTRAIDRIVVLLIVVACIAQSLQAQNSASLRGVIRDSSGKPVAGVIIQLKGKESAQTQTVHSDSQGNYSFATVQGGVYSLRAEMTGYSVAEIASVFLAPNEEKHVDLNLAPQPASSQGSPSQQPEFFDQPSFTVAGVTDTTSLGGHGSDTVVRTRETLAKETVALGKTAGTENRSASDAEKTLRANAEREPASFESNYRLGKALVENGEAGEAIVYLERARTLKPGDYENAYLLALANARSGNYETARKQTQALLQQSDKAELHHLLGDVQERMGDSLAAVREYQRAAELDPTETYLFDWGSELLLHHAAEPAAESLHQREPAVPSFHPNADWTWGSPCLRVALTIRRYCKSARHPTSIPAIRVHIFFWGRCKRLKPRPLQRFCKSCNALSNSNPRTPRPITTTLWRFGKCGAVLRTHRRRSSHC